VYFRRKTGAGEPQPALIERNWLVSLTLQLVEGLAWKSKSTRSNKRKMLDTTEADSRRLVSELVAIGRTIGFSEMEIAQLVQVYSQIQEIDE